MYNTIPSDEVINKTAAALVANGVEALVANTGTEALLKIQELIPQGASVMNGSSQTLEQIGFVDYLKSGKHSWKNLHEEILAEPDKVKQGLMRKQAALSDYYLGSVHALAANGEFIIASNSGSQLPHIVFTSPNLIFVVGAQKIVETLPDAFKRLEQYVLPLENERIKAKSGRDTMISKIVLFKRENPAMGRKVRMILVKEILGF